MRPLTLILTMAVVAMLTVNSAIACQTLPVRVAIDVGHTQSAPGAISATGKTEYAFNKRFVDELVALGRELEGLHLFRLQSSLSLTARPREAKARGAHVFVSIHHDSVNQKYIQYWQHNGTRREYSDVFRGFSIFVDAFNATRFASVELAKAIGSNWRSADFEPTLHHAEPIPGENRRLIIRELGVYAAPFTVLQTAEMPAVLLEIGVIVNRQEERALEELDRRKAMQVGILRALEKYCPTGRGFP